MTDSGHEKFIFIGWSEKVYYVYACKNLDLYYDLAKLNKPWVKWSKINLFSNLASYIGSQKQVAT